MILLDWSIFWILMDFVAVCAILIDCFASLSKFTCFVIFIYVESFWGIWLILHGFSWFCDGITQSHGRNNAVLLCYWFIGKQTWIDSDNSFDAMLIVLRFVWFCGPCLVLVDLREFCATCVVLCFVCMFHVNFTIFMILIVFFKEFVGFAGFSQILWILWNLFSFCWCLCILCELCGFMWFSKILRYFC